MCPLEADHDQVSPVVTSELEGASAVNGYTRSLGVMEAPGPLVVARIPSMNVPVCVLTSVAKCVLRRAHSVSERLCVKQTPCVRGTACVKETPSVSERPCVTVTACVRERFEREMAVSMRENAAASPSGSVMTWCVSVVTRRSAWVECR